MASSRRHGPPASTPATTALQRAGVPFTAHPFDEPPAADTYGEAVALALGADPAEVFKTLVVDLDGALVVGVVPVRGSLDLKALAAALGGKRASMADPGAAQRATGYVVGGISPLGQRRRLPTVLDDSALALPGIYVSGGRRGLQLHLAPADLVRLTDARVAAVARD